MRELTEKEKTIVKELVELKDKSNLHELQTARLLREKLEFFALKWTKEPKDTIKLYYPEKMGIDESQKKYFQIVDFIYFIKELEEHNFVSIQTISSNKEKEKETILYDKKIYNYNSDLDWFFKEFDGGELMVSMSKITNTYIDFVDILDYYAGNKIIYPLPLLIDYSKDFKTIEQRGFDKQIKHTRNAVYTAVISTFISAVALIFTVLCSNKPIELDNSQFNKIINKITNLETKPPARADL